MRCILQDVFVLLTPRGEGQRRETALTVIGSLIVAPNQPEAGIPLVRSPNRRHLSMADRL